MRVYGGVDVLVHILLIPALTGGKRSAARSFTPGESASGTHWIGGWVRLRAGLDDVEKRKFLILPGLALPTPRSLSPQPVDVSTALSRLHRVQQSRTVESQVGKDSELCVAA
jgi:hypothetical protein